MGEADGAYGKVLPDSMRNITISNVVCNAKDGIIIDGFLTDSVITNVINKNPNCKAVTVFRENSLNNVTVSNVVSAVKN